MVHPAIRGVDKIVEKASYWVPAIVFVVGGMTALANFIAPISRYGWAADVVAGIVLTTLVMAATALLLMGWRYFNPIIHEQPASSDRAIQQGADAPLKFVRTVLRLRFSGEMEVPQTLYMENILDWFVYWSPSVNIKNDKDHEIFYQPPSWAIFVNFKKPSSHHEIAVNFTGDRPKSYEIKRNFTTSAVVTITGPMLACELEMINVLLPPDPGEN